MHSTALQPWTGLSSPGGCEHGQVHQAEKRECRGHWGSSADGTVNAGFQEQKTPREAFIFVFPVLVLRLHEQYLTAGRIHMT